MRISVIVKKYLLFLVLPLVAVDQFTKFLVLTHMEPGQSIPVFSFLQLTYVTNTGVAFSLFRSFSGANTFFALVTALVLALIAGFAIKNQGSLSPLMRSAFSLVIAGAVGNLIDRFVHGHVIDFIDIFAGTWHWPVFNIADSCISIGATLLLLSELWGRCFSLCITSCWK